MAKAKTKKKVLGPRPSVVGQKKKKAKAKPKKPEPKAAKPKPAKATVTPKPRTRASARGPKTEDRGPAPPAVPAPMPRRRTLTARERLGRSSPVVEILDDPHPIGALRRFLEMIKGPSSEQQAQIALGAAQLMLLPIAREHRGGSEVKELVDLVTSRWADFGERRTGYHAQEFLKNAFAALGVDRDRIARLEQLVPPDANAELRFNIAGAHAVARDKVAMLRAIDAALEAGASVAQFRRDPDFAPYLADPDFGALLARAEVPPIPVDLEPHLGPVRAALDSLVATLRELGDRIELRPPARLDAILDAERARRISLPNDFRALLTITNGMVAAEHKFFGVGDYREPTRLALRAQEFAQRASHEAHAAGIADCVPLANLGSANRWLVYDPRGHVRGFGTGYVALHDGERVPYDGLVAVLADVEVGAREALATN